MVSGRDELEAGAVVSSQMSSSGWLELELLVPNGRGTAVGLGWLSEVC